MVTLENLREEMKKYLSQDKELHMVEVHADTVDEALADAAVQLAVTLPYVDNSKIAMTGHSSGASAGIDMVLELDNTRENQKKVVPYSKHGRLTFLPGMDTIIP